jgi:tetratricopeptide (TPR) repeat protein
MQKNKFYLVILVFLISPAICWAGELDALKADFLQGNYRRVIFEGQAQVERINFGGTDELNYILGLSYLKEGKLNQAQNCFRRILSNSNSKFKEEANLGMGDTYLADSQFSMAEDIYNNLITGNFNSRQKSAVLYRLSQLESKRGNQRKSDDYLFKLKKDFPLSPELRLTKGLELMSVSTKDDSGAYSVQVGFFANRDNANNLKDKLLAKNYPAYVEEFGGGYRVKVGKFKLYKEALDLESKLSQEGLQTKVSP